ncbi:MAG: porin family protein [Chitinophagaceae bacterium]
MKPFTPDMNDDDLDGLFRDAAESYQPEPVGASWEKLAAKLEENSPGIPPFFPKMGPLVFLGLLLPVLLVMFYHFHSPSPLQRIFSHPIHQKPYLPRPAPVHSSLVIKRPAPVTGNLLQPVHQLRIRMRNQSRLKAPGRALFTLEKRQIGHPGLNRRALTTSSFTRTPEESTSFIKGTLPYPSNLRKTASIVFQRPPQNQANSGAPSSGLPLNPSSVNNPVAKNPFKKNSGPLPELKLGRDSTHILPKSKHPVAVGHWDVEFQLGPELGSVRFQQITSPGIDAGLRLDYHIDSRWSVGTGLMLSSKLYDAAPQDYNPKSGNWNMQNLQEIEANCTVLDIPLEATFNLFSPGKSGFFISSGLSSFLMKRELYTFKYYGNAYPTRSWGITNQDKSWFSVLDISTGYSRQLTNHISLMAEPFIKLPLAGIGYGRVKLISTGLLFDLKYQW